MRLRPPLLHCTSARTGWQAIMHRLCSDSCLLNRIRFKAVQYAQAGAPMGVHSSTSAPLMSAT